MVRPLNTVPVKPGDLIASKYRVGEILGAGGMGVVVAATHIDLDQKVALKFLQPAAATQPELLERFVREARASVRLKSPHVARTLDVGRLEDGSPYMVMEFLEGRGLDEELRSTGAPLPIADVASWVLHACDAIAEAHAIGIVHRDLKPANLFLARGPDGRLEVKVLDFGISKVLDDGAGRHALTQTNAIFGSPAYMSPEQMRASRDVDERSDIWALGVILYEVLTGCLPFDGSSTMELCFKVAESEPAALGTIRADVPQGLQRIVERCLVKDRAGRFADIGELAHALAPFAHPRDRPIAVKVGDVLRVRRSTTPASQLAPTLHDASDHAVGWGATEPATPPKPRVKLLWPVLGTSAVLAVVGASMTAAALGARRDPPPAIGTPNASPRSLDVPTTLAEPSTRLPAEDASPAAPPLPAEPARADPGPSSPASASTSARPLPSDHRRGTPARATSVSADVPSTSTVPSSPLGTGDGGRYLRLRE